MSEERRICAAKPIKPISRPLGLATQPLELAARPADDIEIDPLQGRTQLRPVEVAVVVDPALNVRVVGLSQILQGFVAVMMKGPAPDRPADGRQRLRAGCRHEAVRGAPSPHRLPRSKHETEKVERLAREVARSPFAPVPLQDLHHYYGLLRPCAPHRYSDPRGLSRLRSLPLHRRTGSHVPYKSLVELRAAYMPDAARAVSGHPPS